MKTLSTVTTDAHGDLNLLGNILTKISRNPSMHDVVYEWQ